MMIKEINSEEEKKEISTSILESLPNWFGIQESTQEYISKSSNLPFFAAIDDSKPLGFIVTKENNQYTAEIRSEEHTSELQSRGHLVCRLLLETKNKNEETV